MRKFNVAVVGATGAVGEELFRVMEEVDFPVGELLPLASAKSAGSEIEFKGKNYKVKELTEKVFSEHEVDIAFFSAGSSVSEKFAKFAADSGAVVIDNTSHFRMDKDIPLVVPECNPSDIAMWKNRGIIANPNCSTIQSVVPLRPLHDAFGLKRVAYTTYQAVSGSGQAGINDLRNGEKGEAPTNYPHPIYNNVLPHIDVFLENGYTKEEMKMIQETRKILGLSDDVAITATCVRVPVFNSHSVEINVTFEKDTKPEEIRAILEKAPGVIVLDKPEENVYPTPLQATGHDEVYVGRIRRDISQPNSFHIWCVGDNIRKGAASNAIQIAEYIEEHGLRK